MPVKRWRICAATAAYLVIFHKARGKAFTEAEAESLAAQRPYDLRHACVSTWLNATGDPAQVAEWAGHTVDVLLRVYAKCIAGQQEAAKRRIFDATRHPSPDMGKLRQSPALTPGRRRRRRCLDLRTARFGKGNRLFSDGGGLRGLAKRPTTSSQPGRPQADTGPSRLTGSGCRR
jgi:hypothetical protein